MSDIFQRGCDYSRYVYVSQNEIELSDSRLGFINIPQEDTFLDLHFSEYNSFVEDEGDIIRYIFTVNN